MLPVDLIAFVYDALNYVLNTWNWRYLFMTKQVVYFTGDIYWTREVHCWWNVVSAFHLGAWWRWPSRSVATQCVNVLSFWESTTTYWEHCSVWGYFHDDRYVQVTSQEVWMLESYQNQDTVKIVLLSDIQLSNFGKFFLIFCSRLKVISCIAGLDARFQKEAVLAANPSVRPSLIKVRCYVQCQLLTLIFSI